VVAPLIPRPAAIFAGNDMIALGALLAVRDAGLRCPQDISIMGVDDLDIAEVTNPPLASVSQSGYQLGTTAARILLDRIQLGAGPAKHVITSIRVIREGKPVCVTCSRRRFWPDLRRTATAIKRPTE
jgi:DNA-binding LacI/PurR family transcriptional regulator